MDNNEVRISKSQLLRVREAMANNGVEVTPDELLNILNDAIEEVISSISSIMGTNAVTGSQVTIIIVD